MRIHLDTDLGGDPDDACALVMLLGWPGVELVGVTTTIDPGGARAGCVEYVLQLAGRHDVSVLAGAKVSSTTGSVAGPTVDDERYWPDALPLRPSPLGAALDALERSAAVGATIVAIGPLTNLGALEAARPGALASAAIVAMGGWVDEPGDGLPAWGPEMDWNLQWDTRSAQLVLQAAGHLTLVTLPATLSAPLRAGALPRLRASGPLGELLARQSEARGAEADMTGLGLRHRGLPDDLVNFHYDPVTCATALEWGGVAKESRRLRAVMDGELLRLQDDESGRAVEVVTRVDGEAFSASWLSAVEAADAAAGPAR